MTETSDDEIDDDDDDEIVIDETALMKLVGDDPGSRRWARYVARLTNLDRPAVENVAGQPEMLFQQLVLFSRGRPAVLLQHSHLQGGP